MFSLNDGFATCSNKSNCAPGDAARYHLSYPRPL
jgi:hypothetical protein